MKNGKIRLSVAQLLIGFVPMIIIGIILSVISGSSISSRLKDQTFEKLQVSVRALQKYYQYDLDLGNEPAYEHDYVDLFKSEGVEMTVFKGDTRLMTSALNAQGQRNEGTQMDPKIWEAMQKKQDYSASGVVIGGQKYYVYYAPLYDENGNVWGAAWAGESEADVQAAIRAVILNSVVICVVCMIVFGVLIFLISGKITKSISGILEELQLLAASDLTSTREIKSSVYDIAEISQCTAQARDHVKSVVGQIGEDSQKVNGAMSDISSEVSSANETTETVANAVEEMSKASMSLAESVQDIAVAIQSMGDNIDEISSLSGDAVDTALGVGDEATRASAELDNLIKANESTIRTTDAIVEGINKSAEAVSKIDIAASSIRDIASQTSLLSLNASIEAARAGEAGRGFAVVAEEIGKLAQQSSESSEEIQSIIADILAASENNTKSANVIKESVGEEGKALGKVVESFQTVLDGAKSTADAISTIQTKTESLNSSKSDVVDSISTLSSISEENAASCQETNASMDLMSNTISEINQQASDTTAIADALDKIVGTFKI